MSKMQRKWFDRNGRQQSTKDDVKKEWKRHHLRLSQLHTRGNSSELFVPKILIVLHIRNYETSKIGVRISLLLFCAVIGWMVVSFHVKLCGHDVSMKHFSVASWSANENLCPWPRRKAENIDKSIKDSKGCWCIIDFWILHPIISRLTAVEAQPSLTNICFGPRVANTVHCMTVRSVGKRRSFVNLIKQVEECEHLQRRGEAGGMLFQVAEFGGAEPLGFLPLNWLRKSRSR